MSHPLRARAEQPPPRWRQIRVILHAFRKDVRKRRRTLGAGAAFGFLFALARIAEPWPIKVVFDQVLLEKPAHGTWFHLFTPFGTSPYEILAAAGLLLALIGVVRGVAYYYEDYLLSKAAQQIVYAVRARLYEHLHRLPVAFHQRRKTGDTLVRLSSDIILLRDLLVDAIVNVGTGVILILLMVGVMLVVDPVLTLGSLVVIPLVAVLAFAYGRRIRLNSQKQRKREGQVAAAMHEALSAIAVVQLHGASEREQERFQAINRRSLKQGVQASRLEARMNRSVEIAIAAGVAAMMSLGTVRVLSGALTPGELVVFVSYLRGAYRPLQRASKTVQRAAKALAAAERIVEVLESEPELSDAPDARPAPPLHGKLRFEGVSFAYEHGKPVLQGVDLTVEPGKRLALVGPSGGGKSTLLSLVPRLHDPTEGRVTVDGIDLRELTLDSLRGQVSVVLQESVLFGLSIAENIRYGCPEASDEQVLEAARAARVDEFVADLPLGYDTVVSERGASLSGGQRQRIALARALVRRTPILLLDEPTAGLDAATEHEVLSVVRELWRHRTTVVVTHDFDLVRDADEIAVLDGGRILARGTYHELLARSPEFARLATARTLAEPAPASRPSARVPRIVFYSHNGVGVGHVQRQLDLARAYKRRHPDAGVLLATGSHAASMFEFPDGIDFVKLPSLRMVDRYRNWEPRDLPLPRDEVVALRTEILRETVARFQPHLLVADFMPTGPYGELVPALDELARHGGRAIAGFRDVIDDPAYVRTLWRETGVYEALRHRYWAVCVYGDPAMTDFADEYALPPDVTAKLNYCGYLGRGPQPLADASPVERPYVVATTGGGVDGAWGLEHFIRAAAALRPRLGGTWRAVSGPLLPMAEHDRLVKLAEPAGIGVDRFVAGLRTEVARADCLVGMAGYNTVCDVLSYGRPAVLVPRPGPSREQALRAARLQEWGLVHMIPSEALDGDRLGDALASALAGETRPAPPVSLDGFDTVVDIFDHILESAKAA